MAYLRMKQLRPRLPEATRQAQLVRCAYVNGAPSEDTDPPTTRARYILREPAKPTVTYVRRRHAVREG